MSSVKGIRCDKCQRIVSVIAGATSLPEGWIEISKGMFAAPEHKCPSCAKPPRICDHSEFPNRRIWVPDEVDETDTDSY